MATHKINFDEYFDGAERMLNGPVCGNCKHWLRMAEAYGACRRYPPTVIFDAQEKAPLAIDPRTLQGDTCGEHKEI